MTGCPEGTPAATPSSPYHRSRDPYPGWHPELLASVATRMSSGHRAATVAANRELLGTYWAIGSDILARQDRQGWGARIIDRLWADLRERFPDARGYSPRNLKYMRAFAAAWPDPVIVQDRLAQLPMDSTPRAVAAPISSTIEPIQTAALAMHRACWRRYTATVISKRPANSGSSARQPVSIR